MRGANVHWTGRVSDCVQSPPKLPGPPSPSTCHPLRIQFGAEPLGCHSDWLALGRRGDASHLSFCLLVLPVPVPSVWKFFIVFSGAAAAAAALWITDWVSVSRFPPATALIRFPRHCAVVAVAVHFKLHNAIVCCIFTFDCHVFVPCSLSCWFSCWFWHVYVVYVVSPKLPIRSSICISIHRWSHSKPIQSIQHFSIRCRRVACASCCQA